MPSPAGPRLGATFAITAGGLFMFALDRLIVVTALPAIQHDLGASLQALEWTVSAYTLTFTVLLLAGAASGTASAAAGCSPPASRCSPPARPRPRSHPPPAPSSWRARCRASVDL